MKKIIFVALCLVMVTMLCGCAEAISEEPINVDFIEAYSAVETKYEYKYDWYHGDYRMVPVIKTVYHPDEYRVQYRVTYDNGSTATVWRTVDRQIYEDALKILETEK